LRRLLGATLAGLLGVVSLATAAPPAAAVSPDLLFTEYVEGTSFNKAVEIANLTGAPVELDAYRIEVAFNGNPVPNSIIALSGTLADGEVFVVANTQAGPAVTAQADLLTGSLSFNGDDAVVLRRGGDGGPVVDSIGQVGFDPGSEWGTGLTSTTDNTIRRKATVTAGDTDPANAFDPAVEWDGFATDSFTGLGLAYGTTDPPPDPDPITIGEVQGPVSDTADGAAHRSPRAPASGNSAGEIVTVQGFVTELSLAATSSGGRTYGFFLQDGVADADTDATTSDGIFVFTGSSRVVAGLTPAIGDELLLTAQASEFFNLTQLTNVTSVERLQSGVDIGATIAAVEVDPPVDLAEANRWWERREDMIVTVPAGATSTSPRGVFPSTFDSEIWVIRGDDPLNARADQYARRVFRDAHPLDDDPAVPFDNGNGTRILLGPNGVKAAADDSQLLLPPVRTFSTLDSSVSGAVNFSFDKYRIETLSTPAFTAGADPAGNGAPGVPDRAAEYSVATYNVENLYDYRDDPTDLCDFTGPGNTGCPGVRPPFDYVPASDAVYRTRLAEFAAQILTDLHAPDLLMAQEAEDQDICSVVAGALDCAAGDGRPDTLQELALTISAAGGPTYEAVSDRNGADARGIHSGFLYRTDRVELAPVAATDPVLGSDPGVLYRSAALPNNTDVQNPKALNAVLPDDVDRSTGVDGTNVYTRAAMVGRFRVYPATVGTGVPVDLWLITNHFSSGPDGRIGQRTEQAAYGAAIVDAIETAVPGAPVLFGGDLNVFPRPDDPVDPPSDQLAALYEQGLTNVWERLAVEQPAAAYSYVFEGQAQTLDQQFLSGPLLADLVEARVAHVNADFAADQPGDGSRGLSDHDPWVSRFRLAEQPATTGDLAGKVTSRGRAVAGLIVVAFRDGQAVAVRLTDRNGNYRFDDLPTGPGYQLWFTGVATSGLFRNEWFDNQSARRNATPVSVPSGTTFTANADLVRLFG
jgi:predicted extracellular nuclease